VRALIGTVLSVAVVGMAFLMSSRLGPRNVAAAAAARGDAVPPSSTRNVNPAPARPGPAPLPAGPPGLQLDPSYKRAASICPGLDPAVLAAIHIVETRQGRDKRISIDGAVGPMQFLPATWARYGIDGNGDGRVDIHNFSDALFSAAHYLCANGGNVASKLPSAVWNYNHSQGYTAEVLALAHRL
jgi:hypothetical protein